MVGLNVTVICAEAPGRSIEGVPVMPYAGSAAVTLSLETAGKEQSDKLIEALQKKNVQFKLLT